MTLKTGDMALCTETSKGTLHRYCEQGLLAPVSRAKSDYYSAFDPRQIPQIYLLKALRELGFSQQELLAYGKNRTPESTALMLGEYIERLTEGIASLKEKLDILQSHAALIEAGCAASPGIELRTLPEQPLRHSAITNHSAKKKNAQLLRQSCEDIRQNGNAGCPLGFAYNDFSSLLAYPEQPAQLVSFDPNGPETRPAGKYLVGTMACYYGEKHALPQRMAEHARKNNLELHGPAYSIYLLDETSVTETDRYLLQIAVGAKRQKKNG